MMRSIVRRVRTWTPADYAVLAESVAWAAIVEIVLRLMTMATILSALDRVRPATLASDLSDEARDRLQRFAAAPYRAVSCQVNCLRHSLVLCAMLRRRGASARVCIGVERLGASLTAHAWVAVAGVNADKALSRFQELPRAWSA